jgi:hypothetical protein
MEIPVEEANKTCVFGSNRYAFRPMRLCGGGAILIAERYSAQRPYTEGLFNLVDQTPEIGRVLI